MLAEYLFTGRLTILYCTKEFGAETEGDQSTPGDEIVVETRKEIT